MDYKLEYYVALHYPVEVIPDETTDGKPCYMASHPDLLGCMSDGLTAAQAEDSLKDAKRAYIASLLEDGLGVPPPSLRPSIYLPTT